MADMRLARVALVVALCLALDVANPLMPGALGFGVQNSVDSRQADRPRVDDVAGPLPPANTREQVDAYADFRRVVNELVGRINGAYATLDDAPIHFFHRSMPMSEVVALYLAADVMMVTPLRDGMNLVCKEYVASRIDDRRSCVPTRSAAEAARSNRAQLLRPQLPNPTTTVMPGTRCSSTTWSSR